MSRVRLLEAVLSVFFLVGFFYAAFEWGMEGAVHNRPTQVVPDLRGRSVSAAMDVLGPLNLPLRKEDSEFDRSVPAGCVLRQNPAPGKVVREGKVIRVVLSQGGETVFVPSLAGLPLRNAELMMRQGQLLLGEVSESYSLRFEKGVVLAQDPRAESSVEKNSLVNVVVSGGAPPTGVVLMPDFRQKNVAEVNAWAAASLVSATIQKDPHSLFPGGTVLSHEPSPDTVLTDRSSVVVVVSGRPGESGSSASMKNLHYEVSQGGSASLVRIVLVDKSGEREIFNGLRPPGSKLDLAVPDSPEARVKIFLNGILVEERDL